MGFFRQLHYMKTLYFVRHGITAGNQTNSYQFKETPLSDVGLTQAGFVAERFKTLPVQKILSSDFIRAAQTAKVVGKALNLSVEHSSLLGEIRRPSFVRGKSMEDPEVKVVMDEVNQRFGETGWHHSDEENFFDVKDRAVEALRLISAQKEDTILIVTHGLMLRMIVSVMALGETLSHDEFIKLRPFLVTNNTGITVVEEKDGKYALITWNDHAHLGETPEKIGSKE